MKHLSSQAADAVATQIGPSGSGRTVYSPVATDSMGDGTAAGRAGRALLLVSRAVRHRAEHGHRPWDGRAHVLRSGSARLSPRTQPPRSVSTGSVWFPRVTSRWLRRRRSARTFRDRTGR